MVTLRDIWGESITNKRKLLYKLVSGSGADSELHSRLKYFYLRNSAFNNFVTQAYYFGDQDVPLLRRIIGPARERIDAYRDSCIECASAAGVAVIGVDQDYLYISGPISVEGCEVVSC